MWKDARMQAPVPSYKLTGSLRLRWAKNMGQLFFNKEPIYELLKPLLIFFGTDAPLDARMDAHTGTSPKQYAP